MPTFPHKQADAAALAEKMIAGYLANPDDFPQGNVAALQTALAEFQSAKDAQATAKAEAARTTETKDHKFDVLQGAIRNQIHASEVDVSGAPEKLKAIGWGPRAKPTPLQRPAQPPNLQIVKQESETVHLKWEFPPRDKGGAVAVFIIERRKLKDGHRSRWDHVTTAFKAQIQLEAQPCDIAMEYRVIAENIGGKSDPSNVVGVVVSEAARQAESGI